MNAWMDAINEIAKMGEASRTEDTYMVDGVKYCSKCNKPLETQRVVFGISKLLPIMCDCQREELRKEKEMAHLEALADARRKCFGDVYGRMARARLANCFLEHPREAGIVQRYVKGFSEFYKDQEGLLLHGANGTGKSYMAAALCNALIEDGHDAVFTTFSKIDMQTSGSRTERKTYLDSLNDPALLVLDDLGSERDSEYMQELVFAVIDSRYSSGKPMVITTNLTIPEMKNPQNAQQSRIYDRILQICHPVGMSGESIRRKDAKRRYFETKAALEDDNG